MSTEVVEGLGPDATYESQLLAETTSTHRTVPVRRPRAPGLTAAGAVLICTVMTVLGGIIDVITTRSLGWCFSICFIVGSAGVAFRLVRRDLLVALVAPPLVFTGAAFISLQLLPTSTAGGWAMRQALDIGTALALGAPVLLAGTAISGSIALVRSLALRLSRKRRTPVR